MQELIGRVAVVTGAGSGIGRGLAERFAEEGMRVALADVDEGAVRETEAILVARGAEVAARVVDVSDADALLAFAGDVFDRFSEVHVLCNNAGVFAGGLIWERPTSDMEWVLGVNFWGIVHGIRAFVPRMVGQRTEGHVVNTISAAGLFPSPYTAAYNVAKFAAFAATECLAGDLAAVGSPMKVTALCPGAVNTSIAGSDRNRPASLRATASADADFVEQMLREATARGMAPGDVAALVVDAIRAERFLLLTSDGYATALRHRVDQLLAGDLPLVPPFE